MKQKISRIEVACSVGFLYWLKETKDLRGLADLDILSMPSKLDELLREYNSKYPNGLTGW